MGKKYFKIRTETLREVKYQEIFSEVKDEERFS